MSHLAGDAAAIVSAIAMARNLIATGMPACCLLLFATTVLPPSAPRDDIRIVAAAHGLAALATARWAVARRSDDDRGLMPWTAFASAVTFVPILPRLADRRWSSAIVWACATIAVTTAGKVVDLLVGGHPGPNATVASIAYGAPIAMGAIQLATF